MKEPSAGPHVAETPAVRPLVLIVDDDEGIRAAVAEILVDEGFRTAQATDGVDALNFLADVDGSPTVILLDLMMPVLDGWTFCKIRQGIQSLMKIPVILSLIHISEPTRQAEISYA